MSRALRISPDLALPIEATTQAVAILAKRGAGKTYTAGVWAEEMLEAGLQVVILDPMGAWYGLRSSADGKGPGYPIAVLGGDHGDVPLESTGGHVVADLAVDERLSMIVDQSRFSKNERRRFVTDLLERLYLRNRDAMHVILEEADLVAPQRYGQGEERMLGAVFDLVRRGRGRGLGSTLITQRSATLNNEVLEQADILITLRTTGPADRKAIDRWIDTHDDLAARKGVRDSLPSLPTGTAWVWWPEQELLKRVAIRTKTTYDSSATPKPGQVRRAPKTVADVDLTALTARMAATIEKAKADDPVELRRRIRQLESESAARLAALDRRRLEPEPVVERIEVPVLNGQVERLAEVVGELRTIGQGMVLAGTGLAGVADSITAAIQRVASAPRAAPEPTRGRGQLRAPTSAAVPRTRGTELATTTDPAQQAAGGAPPSLGRAERTFLAALAQHSAGLSQAQLSLITGYSGKSGHFSNVLGKLRSGGLVAPGWPARITILGIAEAGDVEHLPTPGPELIAWWMGRLGKAERAMLEVFVNAYPGDVGRDELGTQTGYSPASGHFSNVLGRLRTLQLVDGWRASDELMDVS